MCTHKRLRPQVWLFDLDDTLMWNSLTYNEPFFEFVRFLTLLFGSRILYAGSIGAFQESVDVSLEEEINPRTGEIYGYSHDRFPESFVRTYRWLCEVGEFGVYDEHAAEQCREIGMRAFEQTNYRRLGFVHGAEELLNFLRKQHHPLVLVTKGDDWAQKKKINALNLRRWFKEIHIVGKKTPELFLEIVSAIPDIKPINAVMVGNSLSDVEPALMAGLNAAFIPCHTWEGENMKPRKLTIDEDRRLTRFKEISEIIPWYKSFEE